MVKTIVLNFEGVGDREKLHSMLKKVLALPDYYGGNLDALWDCLGDFETPIRFELRGVEGLKETLGEYAERVIEVFADAAMEFEGIEVAIIPLRETKP